MNRVRNILPVGGGASGDSSLVPKSELPRRAWGRRRILALCGVASLIVLVLIVLLVILPSDRSFDVSAVNVSYTGSGAAGVCTLGPNYTAPCEPNEYNVCLEGLGPCPSRLAAGQAEVATFDTELQNSSECSNVYEITQVVTSSSDFRISNVTNLGPPPFLLGHTPAPDDPNYCTMGLQIVVDYTVLTGAATSAALDLVVTVDLD